ncbi:hypothetical protein [Ralstonia solanacearum]|uniref:hypothetical protein n=1 Tax=Ralstonia solanacearum TaxID=305 RepID=UPI001E5875F0
MATGEEWRLWQNVDFAHPLERASARFERVALVWLPVSGSLANAQRQHGVVCWCRLPDRGEGELNLWARGAEDRCQASIFIAAFLDKGDAHHERPKTDTHGTQNRAW